MATLRADGSPRISGTEVRWEQGELWIGSRPGAAPPRTASGSTSPKVVHTGVDGDALLITSWHRGRGIEQRRRG